MRGDFMEEYNTERVARQVTVLCGYQKRFVQIKGGAGFLRAVALLIDEKKKAYEAMELKSGNIFHLLRRDNAVARGQAKAEGHHQHKLGRNPFQLGGSFVFGPGDVDRFAHFSETFGDNAAVSDVLAALPQKER